MLAYRAKQLDWGKRGETRVERKFVHAEMF